MKRRKQLLGGPADDRGAALLLVLVVVTVIALAGAALLSFSDTSIRTTVALRDQGAAAYAAEGAAQVAISELQQASFPNHVRDRDWRRAGAGRRNERLLPVSPVELHSAERLCVVYPYANCCPYSNPYANCWPYSNCCPDGYVCPDLFSDVSQRLGLPRCRESLRPLRAQPGTAASEGAGHRHAPSSEGPELVRPALTAEENP